MSHTIVKPIIIKFKNNIAEELISISKDRRVNKYASVTMRDACNHFLYISSDVCRCECTIEPVMNE